MIFLLATKICCEVFTFAEQFNYFLSKLAQKLKLRVHISLLKSFDKNNLLLWIFQSERTDCSGPVGAEVFGPSPQDH